MAQTKLCIYLLKKASITSIQQILSIKEKLLHFAKMTKDDIPKIFSKENCSVGDDEIDYIRKRTLNDLELTNDPGVVFGAADPDTQALFAKYYSLDWNGGLYGIMKFFHGLGCARKLNSNSINFFFELDSNRQQILVNVHNEIYEKL